MDVGVYSYPHGDPLLIDKIVNEFLSQGKFDKLRKECMSDADTKPAYQNLQQRVENTVTQFLKKQVWRPDLNKNQLRDTLRKYILDSSFFDAGINRIVDQVVNPNVLATVFLPEVEEVVYNYLSIPKPIDKSQKKVFPSSEFDKLKPPGSENEFRSYDYEKTAKGTKRNDSLEQMQWTEEKSKMKYSFEDCATQDSNSETISETIKVEPPNDNVVKINPLQKADLKIEIEEGEHRTEEAKTEIPKVYTKLELYSDDSQESVDRMGVDKLRISETEPSRSVGSEDSLHLEINEKSVSESRDSDDSIMNQMSPISQGRLTPDSLLLEEEKPGKEDKTICEEEKKHLTFIGRIPKIKREDSDSSKSLKKEEKPKNEKSDSKNIYLSDSDSSKSFGKSDSDDRKYKDAKRKESSKSHYGDDKNFKENVEKRKKEGDCRKTSKDRDKDKRSGSDKSKDSSSKSQKDDKSRERSRDESRDRSREKSRDKSRDRSKDRYRESKKSSSSSRSSREKSVSHKNLHKSRHRDDSKSKDRSRDKKQKEENKKKNKSIDDHGKERDKRGDRRSTDRDSNERDRTSGSRNQGVNKRRETEQKTGEDKTKKTQKEEEAEAEGETMSEPKSSEEVVIEMEEDWVPDADEIVLVNEEDWISSGRIVEETEIKNVETNTKAPHAKDGNVRVKKSSLQEPAVRISELIRKGALSKVEFPAMVDDFYVKFNSTGFKYFEDWERCKMDCEEEFKEFVDEAENNLGLISDDGSDSEFDFNFKEENRKTVDNLLKGLGNFRKSLTFDPLTAEFYRWTNENFYQRYFQKRRDKRKGKGDEKSESVESIKENIRDRINGSSNDDFDSQKEKNKENLAKEKKALHLKLLNRLKRRAIRQGKHRRRCRRKALHGGIKEKNENSNASIGGIKSVRPEMKFSETETTPFLDNNFSLKIALRKDNNALNKFEWKLADSGSDSKNSSVVNVSANSLSTDSLSSFGIQVKNCLSTEHADNVSNSEIKNAKNLSNLTLVEEEGYDEANFKSHHISRDCHMPLSPESDDCNGNDNGMLVREQGLKLKRPAKSDANGNGIREKKQQRRNYCQKYESQDLYKPRPVLNSSRIRGRGRGEATRESNASA